MGAEKMMTMMGGAKDWVWTAMVGLVLGATAHAAKVYSFTGKISQISGNEIQVTRGPTMREFAMSGLTVDQKDGLRVGEEITIWYTMEAQGVTRQEAGRAGDLKEDAAPTSPNVPDVPNVQDDRAFYNAKVDLKIDSSQGA